MLVETALKLRAVGTR